MKRPSFLECLAAYMKSKAKLIVLSVIFVLIFIGVFALHQVRYDAVLYAAYVCGVIGMVFVIIDFAKFYRIRLILADLAGSIDFSLHDMPPARNALESDYQNLVRQLFENQNRITNETANFRNFMNDYYAMWVHQIKVPIAAMHLLMDEKECNSPLRLELFKIEQYVEMVLSYARLESDHTDYLIKEYDLDAIVKQAVRKYAPLFIAKKISLNIEPFDLKVITDEKWLQFVIEQLLSNALKYTKKGSISIYVEGGACLVIEDTGIGIAPEDIARIGEKGFTGYNGRLDKKSTGLGLYLCKEILKRLSHKLLISSQVGAGTKVSIVLEQQRMILE